MRENARTMADLYRQRIAQRDTMSALDDMKQYQQITQANADGTKRLVDAFEPLYASLSPEQKKLPIRASVRKANTTVVVNMGRGIRAHPVRTLHRRRSPK